jgi:hypothetical protein
VTVAYWSARLGTPLHSTQFALGAGLAWLVVWGLYDFGWLLAGQGRARAHIIAAFVGTGLLTSYMDSHYTTLYGLTFGVAFLATAYRVLVNGERSAAGVMGGLLAALVLVHPDTTIIIGLGFGAWLLLSPLALPRPSARDWLTAAGVPVVVALVLLLPWLISVAHLLGGEITSPFERYPEYWQVILGIPPQTLYHGVGGLVALVGLIIGLRGRQHIAWLSLGWVLLALDFASFGILERTVPLLVAPILRYDYPFSIAWHAPIVPYVLLGGLVLEAVYRRWGARLTVRVAWGVLAVVAVAVILGGVFNRQILAASKGRVTFFGAFASHADVAAMTWLRENTPPDALVLNFPGPQEGDWVPVIAERLSVYYRPQPFFLREGDPLADTPEQVALRAFWDDPAAPSSRDLLDEYGIHYVIVPQVIGNPDSFTTQYRWRRPFTDLIEMQSSVSEADGLTLVFDADGAQVYAVEP